MFIWVKFIYALKDILITFIFRTSPIAIIFVENQFEAEVL